MIECIQSYDDTELTFSDRAYDDNLIEETNYEEHYDGRGECCTYPDGMSATTINSVSTPSTEERRTHPLIRYKPPAPSTLEGVITFRASKKAQLTGWKQSLIQKCNTISALPLKLPGTRTRISNLKVSNFPLGTALNQGGEGEHSAATQHHNGGDTEMADEAIIPTGEMEGVTVGVKAQKAKKIPNDQRTTSPYMTKYERARVVGTRATQIA